MYFKMHFHVSSVRCITVGNAKSTVSIPYYCKLAQKHYAMTLTPFTFNRNGT